MSQNSSRFRRSCDRGVVPAPPRNVVSNVTLCILVLVRTVVLSLCCCVGGIVRGCHSTKASPGGRRYHVDWPGAREVGVVCAAGDALHRLVRVLHGGQAGNEAPHLKRTQCEGGSTSSGFTYRCGCWSRQRQPCGGDVREVRTRVLGSPQPVTVSPARCTQVGCRLRHALLQTNCCPRHVRRSSKYLAALVPLNVLNAFLLELPIQKGTKR